MLPLAEEIRATRAAAVRADAASHALVELAGATLTAEIIAAQLESRPDLVIDVPGVELLARLTPRFDLPDPVLPDGTLLERIEAVLVHLRHATEVLRPIAALASGLGDRMHQLQHEQGDLFEDPRYADEVAVMREIAQRREQVAAALGPLQLSKTYSAAVVPRVGAFEQNIREALARATNDPRQRPAIARTAAEVARICLDTLASMCESGRLRIDVPRMPDITALDRDGHIAAAAAAADALARFHDELAPVMAASDAELARLQAEYEELTRQVLELTG